MNGYDDQRTPPLTRGDAEVLLERLARAARQRIRRRQAKRAAGAGLSTLALGAAVLFGVLPLAKLGGPRPPGASTTPSASATVAATAGRIAFVSVRNGHQHISVMHADGTRVRQLTSGSDDDWGPAWRPGRTQLAFFRCTPGQTYDCDVYVVRADGTGLRDLLPGPKNTSDPSWSPDGTKIAFTEVANDGIQVYVMNADGTGITKLTHVRSGVRHPVWSPDASLIAFDTPIGSGTGRIGVVRPDGSGMRWLLTDGADQYDVLRPGAWAPDGSALVFSRFLIQPGGGVPSDVFVLTLGDGEVHRLTHDGSSEYPSWSPDGTEIVFDAGVPASHQIYEIDAGGTGRTRLTYDSGDDTNAVWIG